MKQKQVTGSEKERGSQVGRRRQGVEFLHGALFGTTESQVRLLPKLQQEEPLRMDAISLARRSKIIGKCEKESEPKIALRDVRERDTYNT